MKIDVITLFPKFFDGVFSESILGRARDSGIVTFEIHNLRDYTGNRHHQADDYLYGGGAGMLLKPEPFFRVLEKIVNEAPSRPLIIFPTPQGKQFQQTDADELSKNSHLLFICGHYKGVDQRVIEHWVDLEYSLGDFVVTGGEIAVSAMTDAVIRLLPGVLGDADSSRSDSFREARLDGPHYTRPEEVSGMRVPEVLLSGHHRNIERWRRITSEIITRCRRPDLKKNKKEID